MEKYDPHEAINFIYTHSNAYAEAKGHLAELEVWKSSLKAMKMAESGEQTVTAPERQPLPSITCSLASTVWSTGSQFTVDVFL